MLTLRKIENVPTGPNNRPKLAVKITGTIMASASEEVINFLLLNLQNVERCKELAGSGRRLPVIIDSPYGRGTMEAKESSFDPTTKKIRLPNSTSMLLMVTGRGQISGFLMSPSHSDPRIFSPG